MTAWKSVKGSPKYHWSNHIYLFKNLRYQQPARDFPWNFVFLWPNVGWRPDKSSVSGSSRSWRLNRKWLRDTQSQDSRSCSVKCRPKVTLTWTGPSVTHRVQDAVWSSQTVRWVDCRCVWYNVVLGSIKLPQQIAFSFVYIKMMDSEMQIFFFRILVMRLQMIDYRLQIHLFWPMERENNLALLSWSVKCPLTRPHIDSARGPAYSPIPNPSFFTVLMAFVNTEI